MNIFVSNLGFHVESEDLKGFFSEFGEVSSAKVIMDRETNRSRGFGFVEMMDDAAGNEAINKLNGYVVEGRAMVVNVARPKEQSTKKNFW
ncbi:MAG: RNA-binding protein [Chitinophagaceae bacterium]